MIPRTITQIQVIFVERGFFWCILKTVTARDAKEIKTFRKFSDLFIFRHVFSRLRGTVSQDFYRNENLKKFLVQISHETDLLMILKMNLGTNDPFHSFREYLKQQVFFHSSLRSK